MTTEQVSLSMCTRHAPGYPLLWCRCLLGSGHEMPHRAADPDSGIDGEDLLWED